MLGLTELRNKLNETLHRQNISVYEKDDFIIAEITDCESITLKFGTLLSIARIFGTEDFEMRDNFIGGEAYKNITVGCDTYCKSFIVKKSLVKRYFR